MRKIIFVLVVVVVSQALVACDKQEVRSAPLNQLSFLIEENPDYIGSYSIERENVGQKWIETGEWTPIEALLGRQVVCFGYFSNNGYGVFRARSDHHWIEVEYDSRSIKCLELVKRK